ncbi:MAG: hypothetical protein ACLTS6_14845 [Anaerobutyricum sp.]
MTDYSWCCCCRKHMGMTRVVPARELSLAGDKGNKRKDRTGYRSFCSWGIMLLLFRTVSFK